MQVLFAVSEVTPLARTGGLADVLAALAKALAGLGHQVTLALPCYRSVRRANPPLADTGIALEIELGTATVGGRILRTVLPATDIPIFLIENDALYDRDHLYGPRERDYEDNCLRFAFFCRALLEAIPRLGLKPDVIHAHDWQTGLIPPLATVRHGHDPVVARAARVFTVHNLAYQGTFWHGDLPLTGLPWEMFNWQELEFHGQMNLLKGALVFADLITAVSSRYAQEIQTKAHGCGLEGVLAARAEDLFGVVGGVDYDIWNPATDALIADRYGPTSLAGKSACKRALQRAEGLPETDAPMIAMISTLTAERGLDLVTKAIGEMMDMEIQLVLMGKGLQAFEEVLAEVGRRFPEKARVHLAFDDALAHRILAGADLFLMASRFEPWGRQHLRALKYGTVPFVPAVGGLADAVVNFSAETLAAGRATGFTFAPYTLDALLERLWQAVQLHVTAPDIWRRLQVTGMRLDLSWEACARRYVELYQLAIDRAGKRPKRGAGR